MTLRFLPLLLLLLMLNGCSLLATVSGNLDTQLDHWEAAQEYGKALAALEQVRPEHPDYAQLMKRRETIRLKAARYENDTIAQAAELARQGQWGEALARYDEAQARLPASTALREGRAGLEQQRTARLSALELELLLARGEGLAQLLPVQTARAAADPHSWRTQRELRQVQQDAERLGTELTRIGRAALERQEFETARRNLSLALRLHATPEAQQAHQEVQRRLAPPPARPAPTPAKPVREDEQRELLQRYRTAFKARNWDEAQRLLRQLEAQPTPPQETTVLRRQLDAEIGKEVERFTKQGIALYSNGNYEEALAAWRKAQQLDPDNERVRAHIERAERVLQKLQTLQEKRKTD